MSAVDERTRHELYTDLERVHGKKHAETLMSLLPPDWESLATKDDLAQTEARLDDRMDRLDDRMDGLDGKMETLTSEVHALGRHITELSAQVDGLEHRMGSEIAGLEHRMGSQIEGLEHRMASMTDDLRAELYKALSATTWKFMVSVVTIAVAVGTLVGTLS